MYGLKGLVGGIPPVFGTGSFMRSRRVWIVAFGIVNMSATANEKHVICLSVSAEPLVLKTYCSSEMVLFDSCSLIRAEYVRFAGANILRAGAKRVGSMMMRCGNFQTSVRYNSLYGEN